MNLLGVFQNSRRKQKGAGDGSVSPVVADHGQTERQGMAVQELQSDHQRLRPKFGRSRAVKRVDLGTGESNSEEFYFRRGTTGGLEENRTRSSEIPRTATSSSLLYHHSLSSETSFRISGEVDGQFAVLCESLGVSSPDDFSITPDDWIAAKMDASFPFSRDDRNNCSTSDNKIGDCSPKPSEAITDCRKGGSAVPVGIKGTRPSSLTPPPPMSLPAVGCHGSTWDLLRSLAPDEGNMERSWGSEKEGEMEVEKGVKVSELEDEKGGRVGVTCTDLTSSCSLWTSNDEDSSSTTPEVISPTIKWKLHISPGSWTKGKLLGHGSFGTVYEAMSDDCIFFAVKEVSLLDEGPNAQECIQQLEKEIELLSQFEHENIVQYLGTAKEESTLYIFLEYVTMGSLASLYQKIPLRDSHVSAYTRQILHGLKYLHDRNVVHRDIKCANILVSTNGLVKLADFGLAKRATKSTRLKSSKGTIFWMAPEVANPEGSYGRSADIWSLGCTVLEMLTRNHPFPDLDWVQAIYRIGSGGQPPIPESLSREARDFIDQCTRVNPRDRPSAAELLEHPFVKRPTQTPLSSGPQAQGRLGRASLWH